MRWSNTLRSLLFSCMLLLAGWITVNADREDFYRLHQLRLEGKILPLFEFIKRAQAIHSGELLEAELELKQGRYVYEIEIAGNDGRFHELNFDAATGEILKIGKQ